MQHRLVVYFSTFHVYKVNLLKVWVVILFQAFWQANAEFA